MATWWLAIDSNRGYSSYTELKTRSVVAQGWPALGDLSQQIDFRRNLNRHEIERTIQRIGDRVYGGKDWWDKKDREPRRTPRVFWNLLNLRRGDLVVALEGCRVCGICELPRHGNESYIFDTQFDYAHGFGGPVEWIDWDETKLGCPPTAPAQSVQGIAGLVKEKRYVEQAWQRYRQGNAA